VRSQNLAEKASRRVLAAGDHPGYLPTAPWSRRRRARRHTIEKVAGLKPSSARRDRDRGELLPLNDGAARSW